MTRLRLEDELRARIDDIFARFFAEGKAGPGLAYGIVHGGRLVHGGGLGTAEGGQCRTVDADTVFRIASMSKSFTAAAILILRDEGKLSLDMLVTDFVPALRAAPGLPWDAPELTIRHCLTMSAGLPTDDPWADRQESLTRAEFDAILAAGVHFIDVPGVRFEYSNLGFALLGRVIEELSGHPLADYLRIRIIEPLGLQSTTYDFERVPSPRLAHGHRKGPSGSVVVPFCSPGAFSAIGGVLSSTSDIARWMHWLGRAFLPEDDRDNSVLSRASRREMQQFHRFIPASAGADPAPDVDSSTATGAHTIAHGYGYGLFIDEHPRLGTFVQHSGGYPGFGSHMRWHSRTGWGVVAFGNCTYAPVSTPAEEALTTLMADLDASAPEEPAWEALADARAALEAVLTGKDDSHVNPMFSPNILQDEPASERLAAIRTVLAEVGALSKGDALLVRAPTAARLVWVLPAERGRVRLEVRLTPTTPPLIHSYWVRAQPSGPATQE
ncbi:serine hydrolase domain-containing protein [Leifsonia kafniensis]|uniref:Serine hydrolase domain-containing protein n=1 Tax=Leifsonia kafniensis TaxID=475957 RepID=A0ABP7K0H8_9MICO